MKRNIIALLFSLISATVSAQEGKPKDEYMGLDKHVVIEKLGQPTITQPADGDGETLIYIFKKANKVGDVPAPEKQKMHMYTFTLDKTGKVAAWKDNDVESK